MKVESQTTGAWVPNERKKMLGTTTFQTSLRDQTTEVSTTGVQHIHNDRFRCRCPDVNAAAFVKFGDLNLRRYIIGGVCFSLFGGSLDQIYQKRSSCGPYRLVGPLGVQADSLLSQGDVQSFSMPGKVMYWTTHKSVLTVMLLRSQSSLLCLKVGALCRTRDSSGRRMIVDWQKVACSSVLTHLLISDLD